MKKISREEQMMKNGGDYHRAECVQGDAVFRATKWYQGVKYVKELGTQHCYAKGGPNKGHRYVVLY